MDEWSSGGRGAGVPPRLMSLRPADPVDSTKGSYILASPSPRPPRFGAASPVPATLGEDGYLPSLFLIVAPISAGLFTTLTPAASSDRTSSFAVSGFIATRKSISFFRPM